MKKIVFSVMALGLCFAVNAADDEQTEEAQIEAHPAYEGFYFGLGFHAADTGEKNDYTYGKYFTEFSVDAGTSYPTGRWEGTTDEEINHTSTRLGGSFLLGIGKKLRGPAYLALEGGLDVARPTNYSRIDVYSRTDRLYSVNVGRKGLTPWFALRGGFVDCETKILTYLKVGGSLSKSTESYSEYLLVTDETISSTHKISGLSPLVALGAEKAFARRMSGRLEAEYKFPKNKNKQFGTDHGSVKLTQKGSFTLRTVISYNVKIGA